MGGDLTSRNMNNGKGSNKEDPRLNNHNSNNINRRFSNPRDNSHPSNSVLNLRASNTREARTPHILKENLKEGMQGIENRMTRSLKTWFPRLSVGVNKRTTIVDILDYFGMKSSRK